MDKIEATKTMFTCIIFLITILMYQTEAVKVNEEGY